VLLAIDAVFGVLLLAVAFGVGVPRPSPPPPNTNAPGTAELTSRFGALWPPGQTTGFALAPDGGLAVVDRGRQVVIRLDMSGQPVAEWGPRFGADSEGNDLVGLAPDADGWYVLDRGALRILRLDANGRAQPDRTIELGPLTTYGPTGLATDGNGNLYMTDTGRDRVVVFDANGRQVRSIGEPGRDLGQLKQPMALAFANDGAMYVSDWENSRVQRFAGDGLRATHAWQLPTHAWGLTVDRLGRAFVPDADRRLVRMFSGEGELLAEIGGERGPALNLDSPTQVAVSDDALTLWVLGRDALARVDLSPYAELRPSDVAAPQAARLPLAVLGFVLLALAAGGAALPRLKPLPLGELYPGELREPGEGGVSAQTVPSPPPSPRGRGSLLVVLGSVGALVATLQLVDPLARADPWWRLVLLVVSALVFAAGCNDTARRRPLVWITNWADRRSSEQRLRTDRFSLALGVASGILALAAAVIWWQFRFQTPESTRAALVWLTAVLLAIATLGIRAPRLSRWTLLPWVLFAVALIPRLWDNANLPYGVWFDEAQAGLEARRFLRESRFTPITDTYGRDASGFYYLLALALTVIPDPVVAARGLAAVLGAANAPLVYFLGRELFGWRVGLAAGLLLAASRWHLDVSRLGWGPITLPVCATLAFWLLTRAVRTSRTSDYVLLGLALGLGMHAYIGFRVMPLVAVALLAYAAWRARWSARRTLERIGLTVATLVLAALPVLVFAVQDPTGFNGRLGQTVIWAQDIPDAVKLAELWTNVQKHALMFHVSGDMNGRHNIPGWPMLDPISGLLVVLGLAWLVLRPLDWRTVLVLAWAAAAMSGGVLTLAFEAPQAMRTLAVTPVLALLAALGLWLVVDPLRGRLTTVAQLAGVGVVLGVGVYNINTFFSRQMTDPVVWESFSTRETIPAREAAQRGARVEVILGSATIAPSVEADLLAPEFRDKIRVFDPISDLPYRTRGPALVFLETEHDAALADEVARFYPTAMRRSIGAPNSQRTLVEELALDPDVLTAQRGIRATYVGSDGTVVERRESTAELVAADARVPLPARVTWRMGLAIDAPGAYGLRLTDGFQLTVDGERVTSGARVELARGNHRVDIVGLLESSGALSLSWQPPGADPWRSLDAAALFVAPEGGNGLEATFYPTRTWEGTPTETVIDPILVHYYHLNPFRRLNFEPRGGWSVEWRGFVEVFSAGTYAFDVERISRAGLWIDERQVFDDTPEAAPEVRSGSLELTAGRHAIRVRLQNRSDGGPRLYLYWTPPGGRREVIPGRALYPPPPALSR